MIEGSIIKRRASGDENGTVVLAEGIAELLDPADLAGIENAERDDHGHVRLSELPLGNVLKNELKARFARRGIAVKLVAKDIGYELRCARPDPVRRRVHARPRLRRGAHDPRGRLATA